MPRRRWHGKGSKDPWLCHLKRLQEEDRRWGVGQSQPPVWPVPHSSPRLCPRLLQLGPQPCGPSAAPALAPQPPGTPGGSPPGQGGERQDHLLWTKIQQTRWLGERTGCRPGWRHPPTAHRTPEPLCPGQGEHRTVATSLEMQGGPGQTWTLMPAPCLEPQPRPQGNGQQGRVLQRGGQW